MPKKEQEKGALSELRKVLRSRGYALHLSTNRSGDALTAKLEVVSLEDERSLVTLAASTKVDDLDLVLGLDLHEAGLWQAVMKLLDLVEAATRLVVVQPSEGL